MLPDEDFGGFSELFCYGFRGFGILLGEAEEEGDDAQDPADEIEDE